MIFRKNSRPRLFLVLFLLGGTFAWATAAQASGLSAPALNYQVDAIIPGYSVRVIEEGAPLGRLIAPAQIKVDPQDSAKKLMSQEIVSRAQELKDIHAGIQQAGTFLQLTLERPALTGTTPAVVASGAAAPSVDSRVRMASFVTCARQTLPLLRSALLAELKGSADQSRQLMINTDEDRADESGVQAAGLVCGRFLGLAAVPRFNLREEIQALRALSARSGDEQRRLMEVFVLSHHRAVTTDVSRVWAFYWKRLASEAALSAAPLPTVEKLEQQLQQSFAQPVEPASQSSVVVSVSLLDLPQARLRGRALSAALIQYATEVP